MSIIQAGEKLHIIERIYFKEDQRRHFIGDVEASTQQAIRVKGHVWVFDPVKGEFVKMPDKRERVIYPSDRSNINIIPREVDLDEIKYVTKPGLGLVVTDGKQFTMCINEFGMNR